VKKAISFLSLILYFFMAALAGAQSEWEKTLAGARKEGQVTVYISGYDAVLPAFQKAYPEIKLVGITGRGVQLGQRLMSERRAEKYLADVYSGGSTTIFTLYKTRALDPMKPALILPEVADQSKWWRGEHRYLDPDGNYIFAYTGNVGSSGIHYNTQLVNPKEFKSYWDLLKPQWKGKMVARDMREPGPGSGFTRFLWHNPEIGPDFIRRVYTEMDLTLGRDYRQTTDWLARGKFAICLFCGGVSDAKKQGLPVDSVGPHTLKEGDALSVTFGTLGLVNQAPHPNAAKVFINWLLSREGQIALQKAINTPEDELESLREDIPKDVIRPESRRRPDGKYLITDRVDWMDLRPIYDFINKSLAEASRK
jgi:iron(III) transport system substrate-binding protein